MKESQSSCSFSITRSIDNSVDDAPVPNLFDFCCNESYNTEDNASNDKFEKETGRYWSGNENSDVNTYHSGDNSMRQVKLNFPFFIKVLIFTYFSNTSTKQWMTLNKNGSCFISHQCMFIKDEESDLFNFHIFANYYQNIRAVTTKNILCNFPSPEDFVSKTLPEPHCHVSAERILHWVHSGSGQNCVTFKALLCGCFNPVIVGNVIASLTLC